MTHTQHTTHKFTTNVLIKSVRSNRLLIKSRIEKELRIPSLCTHYTAAAVYRSTARREIERQRKRSEGTNKLFLFLLQFSSFADVASGMLVASRSHCNSALCQSEQHFVVAVAFASWLYVVLSIRIVSHFRSRL